MRSSQFTKISINLVACLLCSILVERPALAQEFISDKLSNTTNLGNGWWQHEKFGTFYGSSNSAWYYHFDHGWIYVYEWNDNGTWLYMPIIEDYDQQESQHKKIALGWMWSKPEHYPHLYNQELEGWLYFNSVRNKDRYFCYAAQKYIANDHIGISNWKSEYWKLIAPHFFLEQTQNFFQNHESFIANDSSDVGYWTVDIPKAELALDDNWSELIQSFEVNSLETQHLGVKKISESWNTLKFRGPVSDLKVKHLALHKEYHDEITELNSLDWSNNHNFADGDILLEQSRGEYLWTGQLYPAQNENLIQIDDNKSVVVHFNGYRHVQPGGNISFREIEDLSLVSTNSLYLVDVDIETGVNLSIGSLNDLSINYSSISSSLLHSDLFLYAQGFISLFDTHFSDSFRETYFKSQGVALRHLTLPNESNFKIKVPGSGKWQNEYVSIEGDRLFFSGQATQMGTVVLENIYHPQIGKLNQSNLFQVLSPVGGDNEAIDEWEFIYQDWVEEPELFGGIDTLEEIKQTRKDGHLTSYLKDKNITNISPIAGLTKVESIYLNSNNISDLSPLSELKQLKRLGLDQNEISDLSALGEMYNLRILGLSENNISDLTHLSDLWNLESISLSENNISDLSPLAGLTNLTWLTLSDNEISDLSPLAELTNLHWVDLSNNKLSDLTRFPATTGNAPVGSFISLSNNNIKDLSPLSQLESISQLYIDNNDITDISPIAEIWVTELHLGGNKISDISSLAYKSGLQVLDLSSNSISDISDISLIGTPSFLHTLNLSDNDITDITPLAFIVTQSDWDYTGGDSYLENLYLGNNSISDLSPISIHIKLKILDISNNQISDISPIALIDLEELNLEGNNIYDISALELSVQTIDILNLKNNKLSDISPLSSINVRSMLNLANNEISDISALSEVDFGFHGYEEIAAYPNSPSLDLTGNNIIDLTPLKGLTQLDNLYLGDNNISDLSPLAGLTNLKILHLEGNPITLSHKELLEEALATTKIIWPTELIDDYDENRESWDEQFEVWLNDPNKYGGTKVLQQIKWAKDWGYSHLDLNNNMGERQPITDITPLKTLTNITELNLINNKISDLSPLAGLTNLTWLTLSDNEISDLSPLKDLKNLTFLDLSSNRVDIWRDPFWLETTDRLTDITPLAGLDKLEYLGLNDNNISDLEPLTGLKNLQELYLDGNPISDFSPLMGLKNLRWLSVRSLNESQKAILSEALPNTYIF